MSVHGKVILITGAASGIGRAIAEEFLNNEVKILISVDIHQSEPEIVEKWRKNYPGVCVKYLTVDVGVVEQVQRCYETVSKDMGSLDIVINCAGIMGEDNGKKLIDINLTGVITSTLEAIEVMRKDTEKGNGGIIVNIASTLGLSLASFAPIYSASKQGVIAFTRAVAHNHDGFGIKFLTICPGMTESDLDRNRTRQGFYYPQSYNLVDSIKSKFSNQKPEAISSGLIKVMTEAKNGSVWVIEGGEWREEVFPILKY